MTNKEDQYIEAMAKLLLLTQKGIINWSSKDPNVIQKKTDDEIISSVFICSYKEKNLRIYLRKYKNPRLGPISRSLFETLNGTPDLSWSSDAILEITDENGNSIWQFPKETILYDLLEAVRYKSSGAHDLIESLLSDNDDVNFEDLI